MLTGLSGPQAQQNLKPGQCLERHPVDCTSPVQIWLMSVKGQCPHAVFTALLPLTAISVSLRIFRLTIVGLLQDSNALTSLHPPCKLRRSFLALTSLLVDVVRKSIFVTNLAELARMSSSLPIS